MGGKRMTWCQRMMGILRSAGSSKWWSSPVLNCAGGNPAAGGRAQASRNTRELRACEAFMAAHLDEVMRFVAGRGDFTPLTLRTGVVIDYRTPHETVNVRLGAQGIY
jgi:hypothetical protein